ncbi:MAG: DUF1990 family protein [Gemmatimonadaceae bacterium]
MRVLVTGGTGVVGEAAVSELVSRGHEVRLLSRHAGEGVARWADGVSAWPASVTDEGDVTGSADGQEVVLHLTGIVAEDPPESTFERVNIGGTRNMLREAERAGVARFIYISSLGADRGKSEYHQSKRAAEDLVREFGGTWTILRPGNVYGPGDEIVSLVLNMVRTLPVMPVIDSGDDRFQPVWVDDLARVIGDTVERSDLSGKVLDLTGPDETSTNDLLDRFRVLTDQEPVRLRVPGVVAGIVSAAAEKIGVAFPVNAGQLTMLREESVISNPESNAIGTVFDFKPTSLNEGLRKLCDAQPEQLPNSGTGTLERKRIWADISGSKLTPEELFECFRRNFNEATPHVVDAEAEPGTRCDLQAGGTITMSLPLRGNVQVRVESLTDRSATLTTLRGHPLAGAVRFLAEQRGDSVRFEIQIFDRAASLPDWLAMKVGGDSLQTRTWTRLAERMVELSGGAAPNGVEHDNEDLDDDQADLIEAWLRDLVLKRKREADESGEEMVMVRG